MYETNHSLNKLKKHSSQNVQFFSELGIPQTVSQIPQLRNLIGALSKLFYHLQNLRCALNFFFASCAICVAFLAKFLTNCAICLAF